jgi:hypothetical protein
MKRLLLLFVTALLLSSAFLTALLLSANAVAHHDTLEPDRLLVKLRSADEAQVLATIEGAREVRALTPMRPGQEDKAIYRWRLMRFDPGTNLEAMRLQLAAHPSVEHVEYDHVVHTDRVPNDPDFGLLWGLHNTGQTAGTPDADIDAPQGWDVHTGDAKVIVAIVDAGVAFDHADLKGNMWRNVDGPLGPEIPGNGIDDDVNGFIDDVHGFNFIIDRGTPHEFDDHGHGTHVSGTAAAVGDNGVGVTGVAWRARIMALKSLNACGSGFTSDSANAVIYASNNGALVINASFGGGSFSAFMQDAISDAHDAGVLFVAAAGNSGRDNDLTPHYPASYRLPNVIAVAATDANDVKVSFSNFGRQSVHLAAPGVAIYSSVPPRGALGSESGYRTLNGTSMAAPHVTGAAALLFARNPGISHLEVRDILLRTTDQKPSLAGITVTGGRLNVARALGAVPTPPPPPEPAPMPLFSFDASASRDPDGTITSYEWNFGDGQVGTGVRVTHRYATPGVKAPTLRVTDNQGATGQATRLLTVVAPASKPLTLATAADSPPYGGWIPKTAVLVTRNPSSGAVPVQITYDASRLVGNIKSWEWDYWVDVGPGAHRQSSGPILSVLYTVHKTSPIMLTVTDAQGATARWWSSAPTAPGDTPPTPPPVPNQPPVASFTIDGN